MVETEEKSASAELIRNYLSSQSYQPEFRKFMNAMLDKYGVEIFNLNGIGEQLDFNKSIKKMVSSSTMADTSVDPNSNTNIITPGQVYNEVAKAHSLLHNHYRVWKFFKKSKSLEFANDLMERKISGQLYIHDFSSFLPYCYNFDPLHFAMLGIPKELDGKGESLPPQNLESFFGILQDILPIFAKNLAGACGIATLFPVLSIYVQKSIAEGNKVDKFCLASEEDVWKHLKTKLTSLLYNLNRPGRDGSQSLFTNVSIMSPSFLEETCKDMTIVFKNGESYTADVETTLKIQELWVDMFNEESKRRLFTFPVQTLSIATEIVDGKPVIKDMEFFEKMMRKNVLLAAQNVYAGDSSTLSSCCRLRSDKSKIFTNSLGGASSSIGSFGVCTVNLATLALRYKNDEEKFWTELDKNINYCQEVNRCKMNFIKKDIKAGAHPMYDLGFVSLDHQYATLGINGLYECCVELGHDYREPKNREFVEKLLKHINSVNDAYGETVLKHIVNVEQVPAENVAVKLASMDRLQGINDKYEIYANQFIPLVTTTEGGILDRISIQGELDEYFSGGSILHINLDQECDPEDFIQLGKYAIQNGVRYFGINYPSNYCHECHKSFMGKIDTCPHCGSKDFETWCRVIGYSIPINNYNKVRRKEYGDRVFYTNGQVSAVAEKEKALALIE